MGNICYLTTHTAEETNYSILLARRTPKQHHPYKPLYLYVFLYCDHTSSNGTIFVIIVIEDEKKGITDYFVSHFSYGP